MHNQVHKDPSNETIQQKLRSIIKIYLKLKM